MSLFFSIEEVPDETFDARMADGEYTIAIAPVTCTDGSVYTLLRSFGPDGLCRYDDVGYETLLTPEHHRRQQHRPLPSCWPSVNGSC